MIAKHKKRFLTLLVTAIPMVIGSAFFIYEPDPEIAPTASEVIALATHITGWFLLYVALYYFAKAKGYPGALGPLAVLFLNSIGFFIILLAPDKTKRKPLPPSLQSAVA